MRFVCSTAVAMLAALSSPKSFDAAQLNTSAAMAARIVAAVDGHPFGVSRADWRRQNPSATWLPYRGSPDDLSASPKETPSGLWCAVAKDESGLTEREAVFYAIREELPLDCRLEELRFSMPAAKGTADPYDTLSAALHQHLGEPSELTQDWHWTALSFRFGGFWGRRADRWKTPQYWIQGTFYVFLYRDRDRTEVLIRSFILNADLADPPPSSSLSRHGLSRVTWELVNATRSRFPEAATLLQSQEGVVDQEAVQRSSLALLAALRRARAPNDRALLALVVGQVLGRFQLEGASPLAARPSLKPILDHGVRFVRDPYDSRYWYYDGKFTAAIVRQFPKTFWAKLATVERIDAGWIDECSPRFTHVIREGTRWLAVNPRSEFAPRVIFDIAQAYETWWSLSVAPGEDEPGSTPQPPGDSASRMRAIEWYERLLREAPSSVEAAIARRRLLQLRLGVDTGQRRYLCEYA